MMKKGSAPFAIASGRGASGESCETSSPQTKNRTIGRRCCVCDRGSCRAASDRRPRARRGPSGASPLPSVPGAARRPASASGRLCHGDGGCEGGTACRRALMLAILSDGGKDRARRRLVCPGHHARRPSRGPGPDSASTARAKPALGADRETLAVCHWRPPGLSGTRSSSAPGRTSPATPPPQMAARDVRAVFGRMAV